MKADGPDESSAQRMVQTTPRPEGGVTLYPAGPGGHAGRGLREGEGTARRGLRVTRTGDIYAFLLLRQPSRP